MSEAPGRPKQAGPCRPRRGLRPDSSPGTQGPLDLSCPGSAPSGGSEPRAAGSVGATRSSEETLGLWLGVLGVAIFAVTLPMTRLATGTAAAPQLSPWFVTLGRAALAGVLSAAFLLITRSPVPARPHWKPLAMAMLGNAIGYPLLLAFALRTVSASHAAVVTALLPLVSAAVAAWVLHQRAARGFWVCAVAGSVLVVGFSVLRAQQHGGFGLEWADLLLVAAVLAASFGYIYGAQVTPALGAERVICWVCVLLLPVSLPATLVLWPQQPVAASAWLGFVYVGMFSMWIGFFAWYRGLALGGALRVSQTQLLQPFLSILAAVPLLGEPLDLTTLGFAAAVVATVVLGKQFAPSGRPPAAAAPPVSPPTQHEAARTST
jgi:drug/metabolite transporter (DMT)-like permease